MAHSANPIDIYSAFFRDSLAGSIFIEAKAAGQVTQAIHGIMGVFMGTPPALIPIEEMAPLLKIKKKDIQLNPGMWVRFRRGKHTGDLAQVVDVDQITSGVAGIKFLPRIDLTPKEKRRDRLTGKSLGASVRPPARPFQVDEVRKIYGRSGARQGGAANSFIFDGDEYIDGFCYKDFKTNFLQTEDIKPTLEEISKFTGDDANPSKIDLSAIMDANKTTTASGLVPGDRVEVHEGEQTGLYGSVETVTPEIVAIKAEGGDVHGQTIEVPARSVRKRFEVGEHVTVINGKNADISGMVVEVQGDVVTLMSDQGEREVSRCRGYGLMSDQGLFERHQEGGRCRYHYPKDWFVRSTRLGHARVGSHLAVV
jgi:transcription elongation factor SPT5